MWPWISLVVLGAYHGVNPAMGWLFAVAKGLQERRRSAVLAALLPIAAGHAVAIGLAVAGFSALGGMAAPALLRWLVVASLSLFGTVKLLKPRLHPAWVGMRVGAFELAFWSFLMATAHGAGLMLLPVLMAMPDSRLSIDVNHHTHIISMALDARVVLVHTAAMFLTMTGVAVAVYEKIGLAMLGRAWVNLDVIWAATILVAGVATLLT